MFKRLLRSRSSEGFRARSTERDFKTDAALIGGVANAIAQALTTLEEEQAGLARRIENANALASVVVGTGSDEYLTRESAKTVALGRYEADMRRGRDRLAKLENHISNLKFLRAAFATRFEEYSRMR
jgi:hypothetical protein